MRADFFVKYNYSLIKHIGSARGNLIFCILEHWFNIYPNGFYKFIDPCSHLLYKVGESWTEILGCHRTSFATAFKLIGIKYASRWEFEKSKDKFQGKLYASYYDRYTNQTFYVRNHDAVNALLSKISACSGATSKSRKTIVERPTNSRPTRIDNSVGTEKNLRLYIEPKKTSLDLSKDKSHASNKIEKKMIEIWIALVGQGKEQIELTSRRIAFLKQAFKDKFGSCLDKWKNYCQDIASSRFLMGEIKSSFRATLDWALKFEVIQKIFDGNYGIGDRNPPSVPSAAESFIKNSKVELDFEEEEIQKITDEPEPVRAFRLKWLNKFGASNYRECLKDCKMGMLDDAMLILRPSSRYNAKSIASYWTPALLEDTPFLQVHIFQQEGDLVFDKWFGTEQGREEVPSENDVLEVKGCLDLMVAPIVQSLIDTTDITSVGETDTVIEKAPEGSGYLGAEKSTEEISITTETRMLRKKLRQVLPKNQLPSWLDAIEVESIGQDGTVVVTFDDSLAVGWCRSRFSNEILQSAKTLWSGLNRLVILEKEGDATQSSIENSSQKPENVEEKSTFEQAIQSLLMAASQPQPWPLMKAARVY